MLKRLPILALVILVASSVKAAESPTKVTYPAGNFAHTFTIEDAGDKFDDWRGHRVRIRNVAKGCDMSALAKADKESGSPHDTVTITFHNDGDQQWFSDLKSVVFLVDEKRLPIEKTIFANKRTLGAILTHEEFGRILSAKTVEGKAGMLEFKLTDDQLNGLRDLGAKIPAGKTKDGKTEIAH